MCNIFVYECFKSFWRLTITGFVIKCPDQHLAARRSWSAHRQNEQEPRRGWNRAIKNTATHTVRLWAMRNKKNQSGCEPLNLENGSFVNSDNFDATDWNWWEIVQNPTVREYTSRCNTVENIHIYNMYKVIGPWDRVIFVGETEAIIREVPLVRLPKEVIVLIFIFL